MSRLRMLVCVGLVGLSVVGHAGLAAADTPPNIVFLFADDQRNDVFGHAGHPIIKTPNLDALASRGVRFTNAFVSHPICWVSRTTILSGMTARSFGEKDRPDRAKPEAVNELYTDLLSKAGYRTAHIGKWHAKMPGGYKPEDHFDVYKPIFRNPYFKKQPDGTLRHETQLIGDEAIRFLAEQKKDQPFAINLWFNASHAEDKDHRPGVGHFPWPKVVDGMYDDIEVPAPRLSDPAIYESQPQHLKHSVNRERFFWRWDTPEKYQLNIRAYYRMISGIDHVVGRVVEALEREGFADNTIIVYSADNGYYMGDRGFAGKWSHYEQSLRVPLIVYDPRQPAATRGRVEAAMGMNLDFPSTFLDWAGVEIPRRYQGRSLKEVVRGNVPKDWRKDFYCEHVTLAPFITWEGVRGERYMYARYFDQDPDYEFLHDLKNDPDQLKNLATESGYSDVLVKMRQRCDELVAMYGGPLGPIEDRPSTVRAKWTEPGAATVTTQSGSSRQVSGEAGKKDATKPTAPSRSDAARPLGKQNAATPNIVLIISDDQAWSDYSFMGHNAIQTPHLDRLASQSLTFTRGYVPDSLCRPSLTTIITGMYPHQTNIVGNDPPVPPQLGAITAREARGTPAYLKVRDDYLAQIDDLPALPRLLAQKGYVSHQSGKWWEGHYSRAGFTHGMTHGDRTRGGRAGDQGLIIGRARQANVVGTSDAAILRFFGTSYRPVKDAEPDAGSMEPIFEFIDQAQEANKPFFVWYAPLLPHTPHTPPQRLLDKYIPKTESIRLARYWAMCERFDETVGQLVDHIDQRGLGENTIVLYVADNGWIQRPDLRGYGPRSKREPHEGGIRTPIMVRWRGKVTPRTDTQNLASSIDLAPTILKASGSPVPAEMTGVNLLDQAAVKKRDTIFGEIFEHDIVDAHRPLESLRFRWVIQGDWKLIAPNAPREPEAIVELYNLKSDPHELNNLADQHPERVAQLMDKLDGWLKVGG